MVAQQMQVCAHQNVIFAQHQFHSREQIKWILGGNLACYIQPSVILFDTCQRILSLSDDS